MPPKKRPIATVAASARVKRKRTTAIPVRVAASKTNNVASSTTKKSASSTAITTSSSSSSSSSKNDPLYDEFIQLLSNPQYKGRGIANSQLKSHFDTKYSQLVPIINELTRASRLTMSKSTSPSGNYSSTNNNGGGESSEVYFSLLSEDEATKLHGLDASSKMVYQVIEGSGNKGIWTVDVRVQTNIQQSALTKIFKQLETRRLIKPIKAVTAKTKKLYMLYDLTPSKEITGGPWYSDYEFDHEFIAELRNFILMCIRRMNGGSGVTLKQISNKMIQANVSRVQLSLDEVQQLLQTLAYDYLVEQRGVAENGESLFVAAKPVTTCDFGWWDILEPDFHFRAIQFEDDVRLSAHEPHHHS